jgi:hypothetical protein
VRPDARRTGESIGHGANLSSCPLGRSPAAPGVVRELRGTAETGAAIPQHRSVSGRNITFSFQITSSWFRVNSLLDVAPRRARDALPHIALHQSTKCVFEALGNERGESETGSRSRRVSPPLVETRIGAGDERALPACASNTIAWRRPTVDRTTYLGRVSKPDPGSAEWMPRVGMRMSRIGRDFEGEQPNKTRGEADESQRCRKLDRRSAPHPSACLLRMGRRDEATVKRPPGRRQPFFPNFSGLKSRLGNTRRWRLATEGYRCSNRTRWSR